MFWPPGDHQGDPLTSRGEPLRGPEDPLKDPEDPLRLTWDILRGHGDLFRCPWHASGVQGILLEARRPPKCPGNHI